LQGKTRRFAVAVNAAVYRRHKRLCPLSRAQSVKSWGGVSNLRSLYLAPAASKAYFFLAAFFFVAFFLAAFFLVAIVVSMSG
jgi:hypothetical protein